MFMSLRKGLPDQALAVRMRLIVFSDALNVLPFARRGAATLRKAQGRCACGASVAAGPQGGPDKTG